MFTDGRMVTTATPERVFALCKLVENKDRSESELRECMEPKYLNNGNVYFGDYRKGAEELGLIRSVDNVVSLQVDSEVIANMESMRKYLNGNVIPMLRESTFFKVTRAMFLFDSGILKMDKSISTYSGALQNAGAERIDAAGLRGWRFWATFLGFGFLQDMFFLPNPYVFISDVIETSDLTAGQRYPIGVFLDCLAPKLDITGLTEERSLNFGISNALRTLHDMGFLKMEHELDAETWDLYPNEAHAVPRVVTNITICEVSGRK